MKKICKTLVFISEKCTSIYTTSVNSRGKSKRKITTNRQLYNFKKSVTIQIS